MSVPIKLKVQDNTLYVTGTLDFANVSTIWQQSLALLQTHTITAINLVGVTSATSAAVALLLSWKRLRRKSEKPITFAGLSEQLIAVIKMAQLDSVLL